jgi:hypothetical protein
MAVRSERQQGGSARADEPAKDGTELMAIAVSPAPVRVSWLACKIPS